MLGCENAETFFRTLEVEYLIGVPMPNARAVGELEAACQPLFSQLAVLQKEIRDKLLDHADGKHLKGDELVGWLGEIYGKLLYDGTLVGDGEEHDFISNDCRRVSVASLVYLRH